MINLGRVELSKPLNFSCGEVLSFKYKDGKLIAYNTVTGECAEATIQGDMECLEFILLDKTQEVDE